MSLATDSLSRIKAAVRSVYGLSNLDEWICKNTYLNGRLFSFKGYEFQIPIAKDTSKTSIIIKPAQVGISELSYRYAIASCCVLENWNLIYTFPASSDSAKNATTRIDPLIQSSPEVKRLVNPNLNNSETKQFGNNSFLFFKGTFSTTQALSTPANMVIHDEWNASDTTQGSVYVSRLQNRPDKLRKIFSTPTVEKYGVSLEALTAKRMKHLARCDHCNHVFLPDYYEHVKIPDWSKGLDEVTKQNLHTVRWKEAKLICPSCGRDPNLHYTRMEYVAENGNENHEATAWFVSPFSAHEIITPSYLVQASTMFAKKSEYVNQSLGLTSEEQNEQIILSDIVQAEMPSLDSSEMHTIGCDMGIICHVCVGRITSDGTFLIVHREQIHFTQFERRTLELIIKYRIMIGIMDGQPLTDLVQRICKARSRWFGANFAVKKTTQTFYIQKEEEDLTEGVMGFRQAKINRTVALDALLAVIKDKKFAIQSSDQNETYRQQLLSMKRTQKFTKDGDLEYVWSKTDGEDHLHFATLYLFIACQLMGTLGGRGAVASNIPLVARIKAPVY